MSSRALLLAVATIVVVGCAAPPPATSDPRASETAATPTRPTTPSGPAPMAVADPNPGDTRPLRWDGPPAHHLDVAYGPDAAQVGDLYLPTDGGNRGVIVVVHGGAFAEGNRSHALDWYGPVMHQVERGFAVFNIDYRLTDGTRNVFPTGVRDVALAVEWVRSAEGAAHGIDAATVVLAGHSAGGTLAALAALAANGDEGPIGAGVDVDGWLSMSGIYDFAQASRPVADLGAFWLGADRSGPGWLAAASPVSYLDPADPPGLIVHGDRDPIIPLAQVDLLVAAAARSGATERLRLDVVDTGGECRDHLPQCGMNAAHLDGWIDDVVERAF